MTWTRPTVTLVPVCASEFVASLLCSTRFAAYYTTRIEDILGGTSAGQFGMVAEMTQFLLCDGVRSFVMRHGRVATRPADYLAILGDVCGRESEVFRTAWTLATEAPGTSDEIVDHARRCMDFVEKTLEVAPIFYSWEERWTPARQRRHWNTWGPAVLMAVYLDVNPLPMSLAAAHEQARELYGDGG